jgi:hypothetical protein
MRRRKYWILRGLAVAVASLAVGAPAAQASPLVEGALPVGTAAADGRTVHVNLDGSIETVVRPMPLRALPVGTAVADGRTVRVTPEGTIETVVRPMPVRALPVGTAVADGRTVRVNVDGSIETLSRSAPATIVVAPGGLDWTDVGIGAGMALGLMLVGGGVLLVSRRYREPAAPAH